METGIGVPLIVTVGVGVGVLPSPYAPLAISSPTIGRKPAIPNGLKECVLNTMVFPFTLGIMVSVAPLSRKMLNRIFISFFDRNRYAYILSIRNFISLYYSSDPII